MTTYLNSSNTLDLVLTNDPGSIFNLQVIEPFSTSDHASVIYDMYFHLSSSNSTEHSTAFKKENYELLNNCLTSTDWTVFFQTHTTVNDQWNALISLRHYYVADIFPHHLLKSCESNYPCHIKMALACKKKLWRKRSLTQNGRLTYNRCANKCKRLIHKYNIKKESSVTNSRNSKCFFNYVNKKLHSCSTPGPLINADGTKSIDDSKSNILNEFFAFVFTNDNGNMPTLPKESVNTSGHVIFTPFAVSRAIKKIKSSGFAGPDGLPALFWKKAAAGVAFLLSIIFNNSFMSSSVPDEWRLVTVIPVFKKGCPSSPNNYRSISLIFIPCKIMESIIKDHILTFLNANNLISANQHGFTPNKSTFTELIEMCLRLDVSCRVTQSSTYYLHRF